MVIYLRVSSGEQTTENQLPALEKWVADRGHMLGGIYSESESGWRAGHQHELSRLFADLHRRKVDICLVWALDRLTREGIAKIFEVINKFRLFGVSVVSYQEPWTEQSGPTADLLYAITAWVAEFESRRRSERTLAGLARAIAQGKKLGRPKGSRDSKKRSRRGYLQRWSGPVKKRGHGGKAEVTASVGMGIGE